jgi:formylglycine-generating enzyme required for sulfatase activity
VQQAPAPQAVAVKAVPAKAAAPKPAAAKPRPAAAAATSTPLLGSEIELPPDHLVGQDIGNYHVEARIGKGPMGPIYRARQTNIERLVRFYVLDASLASDKDAVIRFLSNASAKAKATNPVIMAVYEAGDSEGVYFYSCEYIPCRSISQLRESGGTLDEGTALSVLKASAEALDYFAREKIGHDLLTANALLIGPGNRIRVANIASNKAEEAFDVKAEMRRVGEIVLGALPPSGAQKARDLAAQLADPENCPPSWAAFLQTLAASQPKAVIADAYKLDAQERAAIRIVEESKKRQKRGMVINSVVSLVLLATALAAIYFFVIRGSKSSTVRNFEEMVEVPAGEFIYQDGQKENLPSFYIDKYEVSIGQYAQFLDFIEKNPGKVAQYEHPEQPKGKTHVPVEWADKNELNPPFPGYYQRARRWGRYKEAALDVNSPVFGVDWFDAYAYAKWKGRRLPTEQEWEKAARGTSGAKFSWGNEEDASRANTGTDLDPDPKKGGEKDGFKRWNPVDAKQSDKSSFGMVGASGNVSEWTGTIVDSPEGGGKVPVIRGGNWFKPDASVTRRMLNFMDLQQDAALGFRTASDTAPQKK